MSKLTNLAMFASGVACLPGWASAQALNVAQDRSINVVTNSVNLTESTTETGQWDRQLVTTIDGFAVRAEASMNSFVGTSRFTANGSVSGTDDVSGFFAGGSARYEARFQLSGPSPFTLAGSWVSSLDYTGSAGMRFERLSPNPEVFYVSRFNFGDIGVPPVTSGRVNIGGMLPAGEYRMFADVVISVGGFGINSGGGTFNFDLNLVPTPTGVGLFACTAITGLRRRRS